MSDRDLRDLLGDELTPREEAELARVDALLRSVPAPPAEVPRSLTRAVEGIGLERPPWGGRRLAVSAALAAALAALFFGIGRWTSSAGREYRAEVAMEATASAPRADGLIKLGERDEATGNWDLQLRVEGLPRLSAGDYYVLWLAKDGKYAAACGTFNVGAGATTVEMTVSYRLDDYDAWVISRHEDGSPWLLTAETA